MCMSRNLIVLPVAVYKQSPSPPGASDSIIRHAVRSDRVSILVRLVLAEGDLRESGNEEISQQEQKREAGTQGGRDSWSDQAFSHPPANHQEEEEGDASGDPDKKGKVKTAMCARGGSATKPESSDNE